MSIVAHYGGIDEIGVFVVPAVAAILFLRWAERRARERSGDEASTAREGAVADSVEVDHPNPDD